MHPSCVTEVPEGEIFGKTWEPSTACQHRLHNEAPLIQIYASDVHEEASENITGFSSFTADFTVPPVSRDTQQTLTHSETHIIMLH